MKIFSVFLIAQLCYSGLLLGQEVEARYPNDKTVFPFGVIEVLHSEALNEKRILNVYLPQSYHPDSAKAYPVIYVLDGSAHEDFPHIAGLAQFMNMYDLLPKSIVVGIANVDRYRDFSYPSKDSVDNISLPTNGGAEQFIRFVEEEVQPFIQEHYKTSLPRTLIGQSMGGLLATEVLMKKPHLFEDYVIVSPSLWWDQRSLVNTAADYFNRHQDLKKRIFLSLGKEHPEMHEVADLLAVAIRNSGNKQLTFFYEVLEKETHGTILHRAVYLALEALNNK